MKIVNISKWYSLIIGTLIIVLWIMILFVEQLPEGKTELIFHIASEFFMAILCIIGAYLLQKKNMKGIYFCLTGFSMIFYSTINAIGYYIHLKNLVMIILLLSVFFLTSLFLILCWKYVHRLFKHNNF